MPKVLTEIKESAIAATRRLLQEEGLSVLTMRGVAGVCGVAVGTLYNYFPSKEKLVASAMLEDWMTASENMRKAAFQAQDLKTGTRIIYEQIAGYSQFYSGVWSDAKDMTFSMTFAWERHLQLVKQISELLRHLQERLNGKSDQLTTDAAAVLLLHEASRKQALDFETVYPLLQKLLT